ncbi:MAG: PHP domain-containing protein [Candidatus Brocadiaceae bacterium]|nr:PHP domain-containing protein [Candidatus Brocadiaceae bacterium]
MIFDTDCHVHTYWSACADLITVEDYLLYASKARLRCFAITDHSNDIYFEQNEREGLRRQTGKIDLQPLLKDRAYRLEKYLSDLEPYRKYGIRAGIELEQMPDGEFIFDWDYRGNFDVVIGAVHVIPSLKRREKEEVVQEEFLSLTMKALEQDIDILAHPTRGLRKAGIAVPSRYHDVITDKALSRGIALEVNAHSLDPNSIFLGRCLEKGVKLAFNTDSHSIKEFGDFSFHRLMLQEAGINGKERLENCFQLE